MQTLKERRSPVNKVYFDSFKAKSDRPFTSKSISSKIVILVHFEALLPTLFEVRSMNQNFRIVTSIYGCN